MGSLVGVMVAIGGVALLVWTTVDLWRNTDYPNPQKIGWQLVIAGLSVGPAVRLGDGWSLVFPLGTLVYLFLAARGPLRRRGRSAADPAGADPAGAE